MAMDRTFREALIWHLENHEAGITDVAKGSGVSRDVINNILRRDSSSTSVDRARAIASYYGESIEQFFACGMPNSGLDVVVRLLTLVTPDELRMIEAQIRGLIASRGISPD